MPSAAPAASERERIAHVLRRTTFGPTADEVEAFVGRGPEAAVESVLAAADADPTGGALAADAAAADAERIRSKYDLVRWWLETMRAPTAGLHERMTWFWHGHLTSHVEKATPRAMWVQHHLLRRHALGNFRELIAEITVDGAMLLYLDGAGSTADAPNENYARELLELFTLGPGNYGEADIRAAARALAGWDYDRSDEIVEFDPDRHGDTPVDFLGRSDVRTHLDVVDTVCDHPACAPFVAGRLFRFLVGVDPTPDRTAELGALFADADLEIRPLVGAVLTSPEFLASVRTRARQPVEWTVAALRLGDLGEIFHLSWLERFGQMPFFPPNVAGWPDDDRWLGPGQHLSRAQRLISADPGPAVADLEPAVDAVLAHACLYDVSDATRTAMEAAAASIADPDDRRAMLLWLALLSPEFAVL